MEKIQYFKTRFNYIETKGTDWVIKIEWIASTPTIDVYNDIVKSTAFLDSLDSYMQNPLILLQHKKQVWKTTSYLLNNESLYIFADITQDIDWLFDRIRSWLINGLSIWYRPIKWEYIVDWNRVIRIITKLKLEEISLVMDPANKESLFTMSKSLTNFFNNLQNNMNKEIKQTEEEVIEVVEEIKETKEEEIKEGSNLTETLEEIEKSSENLDEQSETETEVIENITETKEEIVKDENKEEEKEIDLLKNEIKELKSSIDWIVEILETTIRNQTEMKSIVNKIPVRRWLINTNDTEIKSSLWQQLEEIKKNNFII